MAYVGGKAKGSDHILQILNHPDFDNMDYLEPFIGYGHILRRVKYKKTYTAIDNNKLLVLLLKAIQNRDKLPTVSKTAYYKLKQHPDNTLKHAVAAFTYSYNGKEWGGYVDKYYRGGSQSYANERKNYYFTLQENKTFQKTRISCKSYDKLDPRKKLIYCDPPYQNTTGYGTNEFDHDHFWDIMRHWSKHNIVFISEYIAPRDFICVSKQAKNSSLAISNRNIRMEKLFVHKSLKTEVDRLHH